MFSYIIDLYNRAIKNQKLSPKERAALKAIQGLLIGLAADAAPQLLNVYMMHGTFHVTQAVVVSLMTSIVLGLIKLFNAQGDAGMSEVLDAYSKALEQKAIAGITNQSAAGGVTIPAISLLIPSMKPVASIVQVSLDAQHPVSPSLDKLQPMPTIAPTATNDILLSPDPSQNPPTGGSAIAPPATKTGKKSQVAVPAPVSADSLPTVVMPVVPPLTNTP